MNWLDLSLVRDYSSNFSELNDIWSLECNIIEYVLFNRQIQVTISGLWVIKYDKTVLLSIIKDNAFLLNLPANSKKFPCSNIIISYFYVNQT